MDRGVSFASTRLTADIDAEDTTINVVSTEGFNSPGTIVIDDEKIQYTQTTDTSFTQTVVVGNVTNPLLRGQQETTAAAHSKGASVRSVEGSMLNASMTYNVAVMADASGLLAIPTIATALIRLIGSFLLLPLTFLGTDLMIIGVLWFAMAAGLLVSLGVSLLGGRRV